MYIHVTYYHFLIYIFENHNFLRIIPALEPVRKCFNRALTLSLEPPPFFPCKEMAHVYLTNRLLHAGPIIFPSTFHLPLAI